MINMREHPEFYRHPQKMLEVGNLTFEWILDRVESERSSKVRWDVTVVLLDTKGCPVYSEGTYTQFTVKDPDSDAAWARIQKTACVIAQGLGAKRVIVETTKRNIRQRT